MPDSAVAPELVQSIKEQVFGNGQQAPYAAPAAAAPSAEPPAPPVSSEPAPVAATQPVVPAVDYNAYVKEKFGFDSEEVALAEINRLKNAPPVIKEVEFPDDLAKKMYLNIKEGKFEEVANYIQGTRLLKDFDTK